MSSRSARSRDDRILIRDGRRHHRKTYSSGEFRIGLVCLGLLAAITGWVIWKGAHPDPALFEAPIVGEGSALPGGVAPAAPAPADRGPLPEALAAEGWSEGPVSSFGFDNLYEKINGREGYYKQFGFERLHFVSLSFDADRATAVDIEVYDLGTPDNARGAAAGERPEDARAEASGTDTSTLYRNALYLTRGPLYIRAIGADESPVVVAQLERIRDAFPVTESAEDIPWSWTLFGELGLDPAGISFQGENAFSFGFAKDVYSIYLDDESELFAVEAADGEAAAALAVRFNSGFTEYGVALEPSDGVSWSEDRYIRTVSGAAAVDRWTVGVRGAPDLGTAEEHLRSLAAAAGRLEAR